MMPMKHELVDCSYCPKTFCCKDCRYKHEMKTHNRKYECLTCLGYKFYCRDEDLTNEHFVKHLSEKHLPLQCDKCRLKFTEIKDLFAHSKCNPKAEDIHVLNVNVIMNADEQSFYYEHEGTNQEYIGSDTPRSTEEKPSYSSPILLKKVDRLVDYDLSFPENDEHEDLVTNIMITRTPYSKETKVRNTEKKLAYSSPILFKKFDRLVDYDLSFPENDEHEDLVTNIMITRTPYSKETKVRNQIQYSQILQRPAKSLGIRLSSKFEILKPTPSRVNMDLAYSFSTPPLQNHQLHLQVDRCVTTSTPMQANWNSNEEVLNLTLSEIEGTPASSDITDQVDSWELQGKQQVKSILSKSRQSSRENSEKRETPPWNPDSSEPGEKKVKRVTFSVDTVLKEEKKPLNRVLRKPKRTLTPGRQRPKGFSAPHFQALIRHFEGQSMKNKLTPISTPLAPATEPPEKETPSVSVHSHLPARAIDFKEESPMSLYLEKDDSELYLSCIQSPEVEIKQSPVFSQSDELCVKLFVSQGEKATNELENQQGDMSPSFRKPKKRTSDTMNSESSDDENDSISKRRCQAPSPLRITTTPNPWLAGRIKGRPPLRRYLESQARTYSLEVQTMGTMIEHHDTTYPFCF